MHNDRINTVQKLMSKYQNVNKYLGHINHNEKQLNLNIDRGQGKTAQQPSAKPKEEPKKVDKMRWKQKFIKVWFEGDKYDVQKEEEEKKKAEGWEEDEVGPEHFKIGAKLGQGTFGHVYLVEKLNILPDGTKFHTGNEYAMKILNKKQIMGQNLVKYAKTERDVLTYMSHPFIVGLKFSF